MRDGRCLVFVEVRYRNANRFANATISVDRNKQHKLWRTANAYLGRHPQLADLPVRFDIVALDRLEGNNVTITWTKDAFRP
jgi:putative endonuclease